VLKDQVHHTAYLVHGSVLKGFLSLAGLQPLHDLQRLNLQRGTISHRFTGGLDGGQPYAGFILDPTGNLYATTSSGGIADQGTVFEITP
jgi:hypothetical protein